MEPDHITIKGAAEHNLKNIDVTIPKKSLVVFTGVSGSGKSSLAFDTIFAEGQRRYVESLSSYARQFLGQMEKPKFETIRGLAPTIAIEQKAASKNPRSTVGTITEVYDYLRVLYARVGTQHCHKCGKVVGRGDAATMVRQIMDLASGSKILVLAPLFENRKGEHRELFEELRHEGFMRVRIDGVVHELQDVQSLAKHKKHNIEVVIDRLVITSDAGFRKRLTDTVESALRVSGAKSALGRRLIVHVLATGRDLPMAEARTCCGFAFPELDPPLFSFNAPVGMCSTCNGLGHVLNMDEAKLIPDPNLTIREGAVLPWKNYFVSRGGTEVRDGSWGIEKIKALQKAYKIDFDLPWKKLPKNHRQVILHGTGGEKITVKWRAARSQGTFNVAHEGLIPGMMRRYRETQSEEMRTWYGKFMTNRRCETCQGKRLKPEVLSVLVGSKSIMDVCAFTVQGAHDFIASLKLSGSQQVVAAEVLKEIKSRLGFLLNVGLDYLTLDRKGPTLSGGEAQRIRLASQIGSELTGVLYILDEPSIGLHQRDNSKLLATLKHLRDIGNSLIVVEHDQETIEAADWVLDIGPGAGVYGGEIVAAGRPEDLRRHKRSLTGAYLEGTRTIPTPDRRRSALNIGGQPAAIQVIEATENNLQKISVRFPLGTMTCVTGVSGAGKSTLVNQILFPALAKHLHASENEVGAHREIRGLEHLDKVINIDQKPIGRTPRSNPATYTKAFDLIRDFFAQLPEARERAYDKGRFSFNVKGGRCETCEGDGYLRVEMHFLADVFVPCETCHGKRFNDATLEVRYKGLSIADVLELSVSEAQKLFEFHPKILKVLQTLDDVGLGYVKLGQPATTLSGGEAQRIKLARELARVDTGRTLYILDEPTTGLHFEDIRKLMEVLQRLVDHGNTCIVIEHSLDVIKSADWVIDMGPEGGFRGGKVIAMGTPEELSAAADHSGSYTGLYLRRCLKPSVQTPLPAAKSRSRNVAATTRR